MKTYKIILTMLIAAMSMPMMAQSEGGLLLEAGAEKKINKKLSIGVEGDFRLRNDFKDVDRWSLGIGASYKLTSWLKADAGYKLLNTNFREDASYKSSGALNKLTQSYCGIRHRLYASLTGSYKFDSNLKLSLRERWQYTYRPEKTVQRWDEDDEEWEDKIRYGKAKNQLRSRLQLSYDDKNWWLKPYASAELYNSWSIEKIRYTVGADFNINKHNSLSVFYRFQDQRDTDSDDYDPDMHYLGIGYKFKF